MKEVTKEEFEQFIANYPRKLDRDLVMFCEPPVLQFNDFTLGNWPESVVASYTPGDGGASAGYYDAEDHDFRISTLR